MGGRAYEGVFHKSRFSPKILRDFVMYKEQLMARSGRLTVDFFAVPPDSASNGSSIREGSGRLGVSLTRLHTAAVYD